MFSGESVEEVSPTQNEVNDEDFCEQTQQEIQFAELRYEGSLLQNSIWPEVLKIPLPTATEREISVLFGRQEMGGPAYNIFVKLHDHSRNSKQPASRHHSLLRLNLDETGRLCASLQDLHSYPTRYTIIIEPTGQSVKVNNNHPSSLCSGSTLHFCPLVPRLPQEDRYEEYTGFKFSLHCGILPPSQILKTGDVSVETAPRGPPIYTNQKQLRLVVAEVASTTGRAELLLRTLVGLAGTDGAAGSAGADEMVEVGGAASMVGAGYAAVAP